jgi:hypothetical protein
VPEEGQFGKKGMVNLGCQKKVNSGKPDEVEFRKKGKVNSGRRGRGIWDARGR